MLGDRLKLARRKAGLSQRSLAARMDPPVSPQAISRYESNDMMPSSRVLVGLGRQLGCSLDFLMGGQVRELSDVEFRRKAGSTARDRAQVEAVLIERLENYLAIESVLDLPEPEDPFSDLRGPVASEDEIETLAMEVRRAWKLGEDAIPSMVGLLEDHGLRIVQADLPERVSGMTCLARRSRDRSDLSVIVVSSRANVERRRFTLAHEVGHRVIGDVRIDGLRPEKAMDRFAGAFLVPADHLRAEVGERRHDVSYQEIKRLKHAYGVSASAMLVRMRQVGILSEGVVSYAFRTYARGWRNVEPDPIRNDEGVGAFEKPRRFERLVFRALSEEMISAVRAAELLGRPLAEIEFGLRGPRPS